MIDFDARYRDGVSVARIEEVVVTADGHWVITLFPAEHRPIANRD